LSERDEQSARRGALRASGVRRYDVVARFNGGANAGHTVVANGRKFAFHLLPCGLLFPHTANLVGNGTREVGGGWGVGGGE
jgi:adenylosuccinate synthase